MYNLFLLKKKIYILLLLGLFFIPNTILAQKLTVTGTVVNEQNQPLPYVNVVIYKGETIITGTSTDDNGAFLFNNLEKETYSLKASFVGFETYTEDFELSQNVNLKPILLKESAEALDEVAITYKKPTLKKEADRLVFNIANTALSEGTTLEVLKKTPGVVVLNDEIKVRNTQPAIYINDRKVNLSPEDVALLLENAPASTIQKIEVITNPSSKYDADNGVVINIVMTKNLIAGYNGALYSNYRQGVFPRYSFGSTNFFKTKKVNVFASYNYSQKKVNRENKAIVNYQENGILNEQWISNFDRNTTSEVHSLSLNFDYDIDDRNVLSISSNVLYLPYFNYLTKGDTEVLDAFNVLDFTFNSRNLSRDEKINLGVDLDFEHRFENEATLKMNAHFTDYGYIRDQTVSSNYFLANGAFDFRTAFNTDINQDSNIFSTKLDYELPINESATFSMGLKSSLVNTENDITQFDIDPNTGSQTVNSNNSNVFVYDENVFAAYTSLNKKWEKWALTLGVRVEQTNIEGVSTNETNTQDYFEWFPTANLGVQASKKTYLYTNFRRSIVRPSYQLLNPFNFFLNDNTIVSGNPNLLPSFTNAFAVGTTLSDQYTIEAFYYKTNDQFFELPIQDNTNTVIEFTPTNLSNTREIGLYFLSYFEITKNWSFNFLSGTLNTGNTARFNNTLVNRDLWYGYLQTNNDFSLLKDKSLTASLSIIYIGRDISGFRESESTLSTDLSFKKTIFNKKGVLSLSVTDLFNTQDFNVRFKFLNQDNSNFSNLDDRYVKIGFRYKFGNTTLQTNERTKSSSERDRLEK